MTVLTNKPCWETIPVLMILYTHKNEHWELQSNVFWKEIGWKQRKVSQAWKWLLWGGAHLW